MSNAALGLPNGSATIFANVDGKKFVLAYLDNKNKHTTLDLYFKDDQKVSFGIEGEGQVHLSGYLEPSFDDEEDDFEDIELEDDEAVIPTKPVV